ncbi:MAG: CBS domain-containing protein [Chthonomonadales bacterium]
MKTLREVIRRPPVWVNPGHTVETATILLRGHDIEALPVLDGSNLVGMVLYAQLLGADPNRLVGDIMIRDVTAASPDLSLREAANLMASSRLGRLPVMEGGRLLGVVAPSDLLPEVARSFDPLTELPWADSLREWAIAQLKSGREITVLFLDLDGFGAFNKRYGHIVGDAVLQSVAQVLLSVVDAARDFLCRYGGDEFVIATLRPAQEAAELGRRIQSRVAQIRVEGAGAEQIGVTVGQFGGKRTREREHVHYAATLNSLINLASRDCTAHKPGTSQPSAATRERRLRLADLDVRWNGRIAIVRVDLHLPVARAGQTTPSDVLRYPASSSAETDEPGVLRIVTETTATALRRILPEGYDYIVEDVVTTSMAYGETVVTVAGRFVSPDRTISVAGSAIVGADAYRAAAAAVLDGVNRLLGRVSLPAAP